MKRLSLLILLVSSLNAAAPDDIEKNNQRAWYDSADIDGDNDYTNNPSNGSTISTWYDKSRQSNDISSSGSHNPTYNESNNKGSVEFDGNDDYLADSDDIWSGSVTNSDIFIVEKNIEHKNNFIFSSMVTTKKRLSAHLPWGDEVSYYDHGECCGSPTRLKGKISNIVNEAYFWHLIGDGSSYQAVVRDGKVKLSDSDGVKAYDSSGGSFSLARRSAGGGKYYKGYIYEAIFFQSNLNKAQRRIVSSYLSAKWDIDFESSATYKDVYKGDDSGYNYFVGGIGQDGGAKQNKGTSQGLTITDIDFLNNDNKFVVAGVNYLNTTPPKGTTSIATPAGLEFRAKREWYIDLTGSDGKVKLEFDANELGLPIENGAYYSLLYKKDGNNFVIAEDTTMQNGKLSFNYLPKDGVYTVAKRKKPAEIVINEVMYKQSSSGKSNDEFVELYVIKAGAVDNYVITDQDCNNYTFPACNVNKGDYIVFHTGSGTNSCSGDIKHFYANKSPIWNDTKDDILLIKPAFDKTTTTNTSSCGKDTFFGVPKDYVAYGTLGGLVDEIPISQNGVTLNWNYSYGNELKSATKGESISLTPNANDSDTSACWEKTASGNASNNSCPNYQPTRQTNLIYKNSEGKDNNGLAKMSIKKSSIVISDPVNNTDNPKRIPGAVIRYCFVVDNSGSGTANNIEIKDSLSGNNKENLEYKKGGSLIQSSNDSCDCLSSQMDESKSSINGDEVTIKIGSLNGSQTTTQNARGCAFIELEIK